jgi:hypothetical protein
MTFSILSPLKPSTRTGCPFADPEALPAVAVDARDAVVSLRSDPALRKPEERIC